MSIRLLLCISFLVPNLFYGFDTEKDSLKIATTEPRTILDFDTEKDSLKVATTESQAIVENPAEFVQLPELDSKFPLANTININTAPEFNYELLENEYNSPITAVTDKKKEAQEGFNEIEKYDKWISTLTTGDIETLPVGLKYKDSLSKIEYQLGITKATFNKDYTELTAFV